MAVRARLPPLLLHLLLLPAKPADGLSLAPRHPGAQVSAAAPPVVPSGAQDELLKWLGEHNLTDNRTDELLKWLGEHNLKDNRTAPGRGGSGAPPLRTPAYTEAPGLAGYGTCEVTVHDLSAQLPGYVLFPHPQGLMVIGSSLLTPTEECATVCQQVSGCVLFSAAPEGASDAFCFLYSSCGTPSTNYGASNMLYVFGSSSGDPHLRNLAGEKFDVNQPDDYLLLRVPRERAKPALLAMRGYVSAAGGTPCALYMKEVTLSGEWLGAKQVQVRSLKGKSFQGTWPNGWPFAMKITLKGQESESPWRSWENSSAAEVVPGAQEALPGTVTVATVFRKEEADAGRVMEAQAFEFRIGVEAAQERASILVAQGSHEGLDISLSKMGMLHEPELGGLLGTEKHDVKVEARTTKCEASRGKPAAKRTMRSALIGSAFTASWV